MVNYFIRMGDNSIRYIDHAKPFILDGIELFLWYREDRSSPIVGGFQVVEATTGLLIAEETTEEDVMIEVKRIFKKLGIEEIRKRIEEKQKIFGIQKKEIMVTGTI